MKAIDRRSGLRQAFVKLTACCFLLAACPVLGQAKQKKPLTEADYKLWGTLSNQLVSDQGGWVSFGMQYENADTLFVKNIVNGKTFAYPGGSDGEFGGDSWFACKRSDTLSLQNLNSGQLSYLPKISRFSFSASGKYLLLFYGETDSTESLIVKNGSGGIVASAFNISEWKWNADKSALAYITASAKGQAVELLSLNWKILKKQVIAAVPGAFKNLDWQGKYLAFMQENHAKGLLHLYDSRSRKMQVFDPQLCPQFPKDMAISPFNGSIAISTDGSRVTFGLSEPKVAAPSATIVQVWHTGDRQLYPGLQRYGDFTGNDKAAVWFPESNRFIQLANRKEYAAALGPNGNHAIIYDPMGYEPDSEAYPPRDIYATNLADGSKELILEKMSGAYGTLQLSPGGRYLSYVREKNWWVYDFAKKTHKNITASLGVPVYQADFDRAGEAPLYGIAGWSAADASILVYDQYDIWEISADGRQAKRLTHGREAGMVFRVEDTGRIENALTDGLTTISPLVSSKNGLLLNAHNDETGFSGYYSLDAKYGIRQLVWGSEKTDRLIRAKNGGCFTYVAQRYDSPPTLMQFGNNKPEPVYQSNSHHSLYEWGHAERITYTANGQDLSGVLVFPAGYDLLQKYPMVVSIYERQGSLRHQYVNPTLFNEGGINTANLSAQGYFIMFPDLAYTIGDTGNSVVKCLEAATAAVLAKYHVDPARMGLTGHSFGGYETYLAVTKTKLFAAAIAGSGTSDLVSSYLTVGGNTKPNIFRYEHQQYRMGRSLFEDPDRYLRNSPALLAEGVNTPLLAWAGERDDNVDPLQSKEFYLAMRRLGKEHVLLVYPGEGHSLADKKKQADLTHRFEAWFAKYLKP